MCEKLRQTFLEQITKLMNQGMFDLNIVDKNDKELTTTVLMDKKELEEYIDRLNDDNEELKMHNQLEWVGRINNLKNRINEIILREFIYN